jgi:hypothetical protein
MGIMKKSYIIAGVVGTVAIVGISLIVFLPKNTSSDKQTTEDQAVNAAEEGAPADVQTSLPTNNTEAPLDTKTLPSDDPKMKKIEAFLVRSQVSAEFKAMDELLEAQFEQIQDSAHLSPEEMKELENIKKIISSETLEKEYKKGLYEKMTEGELDELNTIYDNPLISDYKKAQLHNQTTEGQKELIEASKNFKAENIPADRMAEIKKIDKYNGNTENTMKMVQNMNEAMGHGAKNDPKKQKENEAFMKSFQSSVEQANHLVIHNITMNHSIGELSSQTQLMAKPVYGKEVGIKNEVLSHATQEMTKMVSETEHRRREEKKNAQ